MRGWPLKLVCAALGACFAPALLALPTAPVVTNGSASFVQSGNALTVTNSNGTIVNWNSFSIGNGESVRFVQSSTSSSVLNRVIAANPSLLLGALQSNGRIFLINPAGILVGADARIDTAGFVASTLNLANEDFLANRLNFVATPGAANVVVENGAEIRTTGGGSVYLVAPRVDNGGLISTPQGEIVLAAGERIELIDSGTPGVRVAVTAGGESVNVGRLMAESGRVGMVGAVVRQQGVVSAGSLVREGGRIFLKATQRAVLAAGSATAADGTQGGRIEVDGGDMTIVSGSVSATGSAGKGGHVELLGDKVGVLDGAVVDASGASGGVVLVGGDYQGKNPEVRNAEVSYLGAAATLRADARDMGDGGKVIVWADDTTRAYGRISAKGGANGGDGGFVEVSGKKSLDFRAQVDTSAPKGAVGHLLLDPYSVTILNGPGTDIGGDSWTESSTSTTLQWSYIDAQLGLNDVTITTTDSGSAGDNIVFSGAYGPIAASATSTYKLSLNANDNIVFGTQVSLKGKLDATAGNQISASYFPVSTDNDMYLTAGTGGITVNANGGTTDAGFFMNKSGGSQSISTTGGIALTGGYNSGSNGAYLYSAGDQTIVASGSLALNGGSGSGDSGAYIRALGDQTIVVGSIALAAGTGAGTSAARIGAAGTQYVQTNSGGISLAGNSGSLNNEAVIESDSSQYIDSAGNVTLTGGGSGSAAGGAGFSAPTQSIIVNGNLSLTAGNGTVLDSYGFGAPAYIGFDANADVTLSVGGAISLTGTNATNPAVIGAAAGSATVDITASGAVSANASSFLGNWDGSSSGKLDVAAGGAISLTGRNWFDDVELTTTSGAVTFHTLNANTTHIKSIFGTGNIVVVGDAGSGSIALDTLTTSGASSVSVTSQKAILDDNGDGVANISNGSGAISLTSVGGTPNSGELAISADVDSTGSLAATAGGSYGSIEIRDVGTTALGSATLTASGATSEGSVRYFRYGDVVMSGSFMLTPKSGDDVSIGASGNIDVATSLSLAGGTASIVAGGNLSFVAGTTTLSGDGLLQAGGDIALSGGSVSMAGSSNTVIAGGALGIASGKTLSASMGTLDVYADYASIAGTLSAYGEMLIATVSGLDISGGSVATSSGDLYFIVGGPMTVLGSVASGGSIYGIALEGLTLGNEISGSGSINATNGVVDLTIGGAGIAMYNGSYINSTDATQPDGGLITLFFPGLSAGGSMIDGVATFDGGYKLGGAYTTLGKGLDVIYGVLSNPVADAINAEVTDTSDTNGGTSESGDSLALIVPGADAVAGATTDSPSASGGDEGSFGGDSNGKGSTQEKQNAKKKPAQCSA